ncbi:helix-turn-helix domain-containing protein [Algoriphagus sp. NG3]|uniref:helix-turn-helix domain-containing protein n=1 Tax=Algoriphagus sp. NG3 TaxID=3097546 RepID=UPI002A816C27|nr:helix-turn-helix domain-containing protein [Algoriphagus sp. NG3]WPR76249.1 helix-turn-helix domain-containing protein [Algoriphagus sp. NG3]
MRENKLKYNNYRIEIPSRFKEVFTHFYFAENKTNELISKTLLPSYQTILIFNFGEKPYLFSKQNIRIKVDKYLILGPIKQAFDYALPPNTEILTINFKDDAFYRFFSNTASSENLIINPEDLVSEDCFGALWYELSKMDDSKARVDHILKFSEPYLVKRNKIAEELANFPDPALNPIKSIASQNNVSQRSIQLQHKKHFGYSAKEHNRYQRFLKAIDLIQKVASNASKVDWFELVAECGYYDQSQLINDFKNYIHLTPTQYLKFQQDICNPIS